jgi:RNA polymerase sigma-70 factor (ECF subfamily)
MGDPQFEAFVRRHQLLLRGLARKLSGQSGVDPEDLVQETFERALRHFDALSLQGEGNQRAWLCTSLHNRFLDLCRRRRTEVMEQPELRLLRIQQELSPAEQAQERWERISAEDFRAAIGRLKPNLREAYELHVGGLKYRAIAQKLGVPEGTVGSWLFQARKELNELLTPLTRD